MKGHERFKNYKYRAAKYVYLQKIIKKEVKS